MELRTCELNTSVELKRVANQTMASSKSLSNRKSEAISHKTDVFPIDAAGLFVKETHMLPLYQSQPRAPACYGSLKIST